MSLSNLNLNLNPNLNPNQNLESEAQSLSNLNVNMNPNLNFVRKANRPYSPLYFPPYSQPMLESLYNMATAQVVERLSG